MKTNIASTDELEKSVGNPVLVVDLATGVVTQGVLNGITEQGPNRLRFYSIQHAPLEAKSFTSRYSRVGTDVKLHLESKLNADSV